MNVALWIVQGLLAVVFLIAGSSKVVMPVAELANQMAWVAAVPVWVTKLAGIAEVLGAVGLIVPAASRIKPGLTVVAAIGLGTVMVLALGLHVTRNEFGMLAAPAVLLALSGFVGYGRWKVRPIAPKSEAARLATAE